MSKISQLVDALFNKLENKRNKRDVFTSVDSDEDKNYYLSMYGTKRFKEEITESINNKQDKLISEGVGQNVHTINQESILGEGDITVPTMERVNEIIQEYIHEFSTIKFEIVNRLPSTDEGKPGVIYLIQDTEDVKLYDQWILVDEYSIIYHEYIRKWVHLGTTSTNLKDYVKITVFDEAVKSLDGDIAAVYAALESANILIRGEITTFKTQMGLGLSMKADTVELDNAISDLVRAMEDVFEDKIIFETKIQGRVKNALSSKFARKEHYHDIKHLKDEYGVLDGKQDKLIDNPKDFEVQNLKTINGKSILGEGNLVIGQYGKLQSDWEERDPDMSSFILNKPNLDVFLNRTEYEEDIGSRMNTFKSEFEKEFYNRNYINQYFDSVDRRLEKTYKDLQPKLVSGVNIQRLKVNGTLYDLNTEGTIEISTGGESGDDVYYPLDDGDDINYPTE